MVQSKEIGIVPADHQVFFQELMNLASSPNTVSACEQLINQIEKFQVNRKMYGQFLRGNNNSIAYCVNQPIHEEYRSALFAIIFVSANIATKMELHNCLGIGVGAWRNCYPTIIKQIEHELEI